MFKALLLFILFATCLSPLKAFALESDATEVAAPTQKDFEPKKDEIGTSYQQDEKLSPESADYIQKLREKDQSEAENRITKEGTNVEEVEGDEDELPARSVRIDLNPVKEAAAYELVITPTKRIWAEPLKLHVNPSEQPFVRLRLTPGQYTIRTRSIDFKQNPGPWSSDKNFWIQFKAITDAFPARNEEIEPKGSKSELITFEWPVIPETKYYFLRLKDADGKTLKMILTKQTWYRTELKINSKYSWSVTPLSEKSEYAIAYKNDDRIQYSPFSITTPDPDGRGTLVQITSHPRALKYQYEVVSVDRKDETSQPTIVESYEPEYKFRLPPGEYEFRARNIFPDKGHSNWSAPSKFFVKRYNPKPIEPIKADVVESTDDEQSKVLLTWKGDNEAGSYKVFIYNQQNEMIYTERTTDTKLLVKLPHDSVYRWTVRAYSPREPAQESLNIEETTKLESFSIDHYDPLLLNSVEETSQFYGWVKHISSVEQFEGRNWDYNAVTKQNLFGGEGEAALGWWWRRKQIGFLANFGYGGFLFRDEIHNYSNAGIYIGKRWLFDEGQRIRAWIGMQYREMPEVLTTPFTHKVEYSVIKSVGPSLQAIYSKPINNIWGVHYSGSVFLSQIDRGTPDGMEQIPMLSMRIALMASYVWSKQAHLMMGYAYRLEQAHYYSADTPGEVNETKVGGHYLSLMWEFALAEKEK